MSGAGSVVGTDVLVVGGGVIGTAIADALSSEGMRVRLIEEAMPAAGASGAAAGMLAPISEAEGDSPLLRLGLESLGLFPSLLSRLRSETGIDPEFEASGLLQLALGEGDATRLRALPQVLSGILGSFDSGAAKLEWVDAGDLASLAPGLAPGIRGGLLSMHEAHVRPPLFVKALAESARRRGAIVETGTRATRLCWRGDRVSGVETTEGLREADHVVLATGVWTPALLASLPESGQDELPAMITIEPVRGQILSLEAPLPAMKTIAWSKGLYFVPKRDGSWVVGATQERVGFDRRVTAAGVASLLDGAVRLFPSLADATLGRTWAGLRPVTADGLPAVGAVPGHAGLYVAAGHGRNGVLLAPVTARRIARTILGKLPSSEGPAPVDAADPLDPMRSIEA